MWINNKGLKRLLGVFVPGLAILSLVFGTALAAGGASVGGLNEEELLTPEEAFAFEATAIDGQTLRLDWRVADGYYLYRERLGVESKTSGLSIASIDLPQGEMKEDKYFGQKEVYRGGFSETVHLSNPKALESLDLLVKSQGCADAGLCYPPQRRSVSVDLPVAVASAEGLNRAFGVASSSDGNPLAQIVGGGLGDSKLGNGGLGLNDDSEFLPVEQAFVPSVRVDKNGQLALFFAIADGYYLYRDKLSLSVKSGAVQLGEWTLPKGEIKDDPSFGPTAVFHQRLEVGVPVYGQAGERFEVTLGYQGCADAGLCYPPQKSVVALEMSKTVLAPDGLVASASAGAGDDQSLSGKASSPVVRDAAPADESDQGGIAALLNGGNVLKIVLGMFLAGLGLAFTACVYPMIPILSSIIVGQGGVTSPAKGFVLSLVYVEAMALTYAAIGVASGFAGAGVQGVLQTPWVLGAFALVFVALALSMFGFYNIQLPASIQGRLSEISNRQRGGNLLGVAVMGVLSALIVGPCAGPVLFGAAAYIAQTEDYALGGLAFFALGNGMGAPLLLIGLTGGKLLPKAGGWMDTVKAVFGVVMLGVAILMLERVLPPAVFMTAWAVLFIVSGVYLGALDAVTDRSRWYRLWKGLGLVLMLWGVLVLIGAATGGRDVTNPLHRLMQPSANAGLAVDGHSSAVRHFKRVKSVQDLEREIAAAKAEGKAVMLDFYADWCTYCLTLEDYVFPHPSVQAALKDTVLLQADVTATDEQDKALMNRFGIFAPPAILFFDKQGRELRRARVIGEMDVAAFAEHVNSVMNGL